MISKGDQVVKCLTARKKYFEVVHFVAREKWSHESLT